MTKLENLRKELNSINNTMEALKFQGVKWTDPKMQALEAEIQAIIEEAKKIN